MTEAQAALVVQAERALRTARLALDDGDGAGAVNRAYNRQVGEANACFYLARAALLGVDEAPKTHKGTHARFKLHFVADGPLSPEDGRTLTDAFAACQRSDYDTFAVTDTAAAADLLADAERFVEATRALV